MSKYIFVLFLFLPFASCEDRSAVEALQRETEAIHDEAMKDMAELNRTNRALRDAVDRLDSTAADRRAALLDAQAAIQKADEEMMAWMAQYAAPDEQPAAEAVRYLEAQKKAIEQNHRDIRAAIERGQQLLQQ